MQKAFSRKADNQEENLIISQGTRPANSENFLAAYNWPIRFLYRFGSLGIDSASELR